MGLEVLCLWDCGANPMGTHGVVVAAVWDLWGSMGVLWLRCRTYGADLRFCNVVVAAVPTLWGSMGVLWLRCGTYGGTYGEPMGSLWGTYGVDLWGYECLWGFPRLLMGLRREPYGDLWGCCGCCVALWGCMGVLWLQCGTMGLWG